ncbi:hypothetical protein GCM10008949_25240 [Deinococcus humi]|nr:hypothetical protein GCM10008949_25240 [Deinococcus humi]
MFLKKDVQHGTVFINGPPQPVPDTSDAWTPLVHVPPRAPPGFPVTPLVNAERRKIDVPLAKRVVTDVEPTLLKQGLSVPIAQRKAVGQLSGHAR